MANQQNSYTGSQGTGSDNADFSFTFPSFTTSEVKVEVDNVVKTLTTHYTVENFNTTSGGTVRFTAGNIPTGTTPVRIFRQTDVDSPKATFSAGSSLKAGEINDNFKQVRHALQEAIGANATDRQVQEFNIEDGAVSSAKIKDLTIVDADISATAEIEVYKLKDGAARQVLQTDTAGTGVEWTSNVDLPGTLDVTGNVDFDANLNVDGNITVDGNSTIGGSLEVGGANAGTFDVATNGRITAPDGTLAKIQLGITGDNEIDTSSGNITIDSAGGTTTIDDNLEVTGTANFSNATTTFNGSQVVTETASQTLTNKTLTTPVINDMSGTAVVTSGTSTSDNKVYSAKRAGEIFYGKGTVEEIQSGESWTAADDKVATTAAIDARIIDLVDDVGGFVPIASETVFPDANPDINNPATGGTIVSIKAIGTSRTPSGGNVSISNGNVSNNATITITGCGSTVLAAGFGVLVETTSTLHTYAFHRLVPKATEVTTVAANTTQIGTVHTNISQVQTVHNNITDIVAVANDATDIGAVAGKATEIGRLGTVDAVADMAILGTADVVSDLNTLGTADVVADMNMLATSDVVADMNMLAVSDVISDMNDLATSGNITAMSTCSTNIASINNASANISSANNFGDQYQVASNNPSTDGGGNALAAGDLYFNTSANELKVYNGSSWQAGVTATGNFALTTGNTFTGDNVYNDSVKLKIGTGSDLELYHNGSHSYLDNSTGSLFLRSDTIKLRPKSVDEDGIEVFANGEVRLYYDNSKKLHTNSTGIYVTGNITLPDDGEVKFGNSGDLSIYHNDSLGSSWIYNSTGPLQIRSDSIFLRSQSDGASYINCTDNGSVDLYYNGSKKLETINGGVSVTGQVVSTVNFRGGDNVELSLGDAEDLKLLHDGTNSLIRDTGNGYLKIDSNGSGIYLNKSDGESMASFITDGAVELYHNGSKKFETTSDGNFSYGHLYLPNDTYRLKIGGSYDLQIYHNGSDSYIDNDTGRLLINTASGEVQINKATSEYMARFIADGAVELYHDNSKKFETTSTGVSVTGKATFPDGNSNGIVIGNSGDYRLFHNGSNSYIENDTGNFIIDNGSAGDVYINAGDDIFIRPQGSEDGIKVIGNAGVQLFYDNSKKLETISTGANITGKLGFNTTSPTSLIDARDTTGATIQCSNTSSNIGKIGINVGTNENFVFSRGASSSDRRQLTFMLGNNTCAKFDTNLNFIPASDSTHDFGANTVRWRNLYADTLYGDGSNLTGISTDLVGDTSPQLGGDLDTNSHHILIDDDHEVKWGNDSDLRIFHANGNANFIQSYNNHNLRISAFGTGRIKLQTNEGEDGVVCIPNAATELYYDNSKKLHTTSAGAQCTGSLTLTEHLVVGDNKELKLGASSDMTIWHSGSDFNMYNSTGELIISNASGTGTGEGAIIFKTGNNNTRAYLSKNGHFYPAANNSFDLGTNTNRWRNIYTNDLHLSNVGHSNEIDGTWGDWTIQEGESDLFLKNNRSGKKYKFNLMEVS